MKVIAVSATRLPINYTTCQHTALKGIYTCNLIGSDDSAVFDFDDSALYYVDRRHESLTSTYVEYSGDRITIHIFDNVVKLTIGDLLLASAALPFRTGISGRTQVYEVGRDSESITVLASCLWIIAKLVISEK